MIVSGTAESRGSDGVIFHLFSLSACSRFSSCIGLVLLCCRWFPLSGPASNDYILISCENSENSPSFFEDPYIKSPQSILSDQTPISKWSTMAREYRKWCKRAWNMHWPPWPRAQVKVVLSLNMQDGILSGGFVSARRKEHGVLETGKQRLSVTLIKKPDCWQIHSGSVICVSCHY